MSYTYAQLRDAVESALQDSTNLIWLTPELDELIALGLNEIASYVPYMVKTTLTTAASKDITLSSENVRNEVREWTDKWVEYPVAQDPIEKRGYSRIHNTITLDVDTTPAASESVYLNIAKRHILNPAMDDLGGAVNAITALGSATLVVKSLGTGYVYEDTTFLITGATTVYRVTRKATITGGVATLSISPVLAAGVAEDAVVTLTQATPTLDADLEMLLTDLVVAHALVNKGAKHVNVVNVGSRNTLQEYLLLGNAQLQAVMFELRKRRKPKTIQLWPTG